MQVSQACLLALGAALLGCSSASSNASPPPPDDAAMGDAGPIVDAQAEAVAGYPAAHPAAPQVLDAGGPIMTAPKLVTITFDSDPLQAQVNAFVSNLATATAYWSGAVAEYGVGPIASTLSIPLTETPATNLADSDIQTWLAAKIMGMIVDGGAGDAGPGPAFPQPDGETIYAIYYPDTVTITLDGFASCQGFDGYHGDFQLPNQTYVTYAVLARCPPPVSSVTVLDNLTAAASHEYIEASTDPLAVDNPAWSMPDMDHMAWEYVGGGGEIGDMCAPYPNVFYDPPGLPYLVQRVWSNKQAAESHDPCQPDGASPYFNSVPVLTDTLMINDPMAGMFTTLGVKIPIGGSAVVPLELFSDAPTSGPWSVQAIDVASYFYGLPAELSFSFDKTKGTNGDKIQMTIKVLQAGTGDAEAFWIQSQLGSVQTVWIGLVGN